MYIYIYIYIYLSMYNVYKRNTLCVSYIYIYIYVQRERERDTHAHTYIQIYTSDKYPEAARKVVEHDEAQEAQERLDVYIIHYTTSIYNISYYIIV